MKKLMFIGQVQSAEFAKKKVYDYSPSRTNVLKRTDIPKLKQEIANVNNGYSRLKNMGVQEIHKLKDQQKLNQITVRGMRLNYRTENNTKIDKLQIPVSKRLESYKFNKEKDKEFAEVDNWLENRKKRNQVTAPKIESSKVTTNPNPKVNAAKSTTTLLSPKPRIGIKGKLGLGAVGLLGAGAIGYSIYRKVRSDKGKKRR